MRIITVTSDIISAIFLFIIILGNYRIKRTMVARTRYFRISLWVCFAGLVFDAMSYILDGCLKSDVIMGMVNYLSFILIDVLIACYSYYTFLLIKEKEPDYPPTIDRIVSFICLADIAYISFGAIFGYVYSIEKGSIVNGPLRDTIIILPVICLVMMFLQLVLKLKVLGVREVLILSMYLVMPGLSALIQLIDPELGSGYVGSACALTVVYVMLQSRNVIENEVRAELYNRMSKHDELTGLKNRRAYQETISTIGSEELVSAIFCDVNSLKHVNDTLGHEAGDKLIQRVALLLSREFEEKNVYRISGDEFVVIMTLSTTEGFSERMERFRNILLANEWIASEGYATGKGSDIINIIKDAEQSMYEDKRKYYEATGRNRRR